MISKDIILDLIYSLIAIILALLVGAVLIKFTGHSPLEAYYYLFFGAFGSSYNFAQTMLKTIPLIFSGLAVAVAFQSGLFNIGGEGQLYWGALATAVTALTFSGLPSVLLIPLSLASGAAAGAAWAFIPGLLKAETGAHEVITTIMFNYIGILATTFLLKNYFKADGPVDQSDKIPAAARSMATVTKQNFSAPSRFSVKSCKDKSHSKCAPIGPGRSVNIATTKRFVPVSRLAGKSSVMLSTCDSTSVRFSRMQSMMMAAS